MSAADILVSGVKRAQSVTVMGTLGGITRMGSVQVLDPNLDVPSLKSLTPATASIAGTGGSATLTVALDLPAPSGGINVSITSMNGWTVPATVMVPAGQLQAQFTVTQAGASTSDVITATLGANSFMSNVAINMHPVINEVDYDQPGTDTNEFVEIFNPSSSPIDLTNLAVVLATNTANEYKRIALSGMLAGGAYLVIGSATVTVPAGTAMVTFSAASNNITNSAPTGVAIIDTVKLTVIDAVTFGGTVNAQLKGFTGTTSFLEGTAKTLADSGAGSCVRIPNGQDTDNLTADWQFSSANNPSPGAPNN